MKTLILTGGGTLGHCIPCISVAEKLKDKFDKIVYVGSVNGLEKQTAEEHGLEYFSVTTPKLKRQLAFSNLLIPFELIKGIRQAEKILSKLNASAVFSKGGYAALPTAIAAGKMKIPLILHESDITMGLANKLCAKYATEVLTTFKETADKLPNGVFTGATVSETIFGAGKEEAFKRYRLKKDKPVLLVIGGSSGSQAINDAVTCNLKKLTEKYSILHLCGGREQNTDNSTKPSTSKNNEAKRYVKISFEKEMKYAYAVADFALTRGGSNCLAELISMKIPALVIPLPTTVSRGDQIQNANYYKNKGAFKVLYQEDVTPQRLLKKLDETYNNRLIITLAQKKLSPRNNDAVTNAILRTVGIRR